MNALKVILGYSRAKLTREFYKPFLVDSLWFEKNIRKDCHWGKLVDLLDLLPDYIRHP